MKGKKKFEFLLLTVITVIGFGVWLFLKSRGFLALFLPWIFPSLYLSFKARKHIRKSFLFSLFTGIPAVLMIDYIAHLTGIWRIYTSSFPVRILGFTTIETLFWGFFQVYYVVLFYEYFVDYPTRRSGGGRKVNPRIKYLIIFIFVLFIIFLTLLWRFQELLLIPHFYLFLGLSSFVFPAFFLIIRNSRFVSKFLLPAVYFFFVAFLCEIIALKLDIWGFGNKEFIGWVALFGTKFPIEELLFWMMSGAIGILALYELFADDCF